MLNANVFSLVFTNTLPLSVTLKSTSPLVNFMLQQHASLNSQPYKMGLNGICSQNSTPPLVFCTLKNALAAIAQFLNDDW